MFKNVNFLEFISGIKDSWYEDRFIIYKNIPVSTEIVLLETTNNWGEIIGIDFINSNNDKPFTIICDNCGYSDCFIKINCIEDYDYESDCYREILDSVNIGCPECGNFLVED